MTTDRDDLIRDRAYGIWEAEGSPHGRHDQHWAQASREIDEASAAPAETVAPVKPKRVAKAKPIDSVPTPAAAAPAAKPKRAAPAAPAAAEPVTTRIKRAAKAVVAEITEPAAKGKRR